jgi:hypothetical protein
VLVAFFRSLRELESAADDLRRVLLPAGVVDTKVAALDNDWSGLKFVWRKEHRGRRAKA